MPSLANDRFLRACRREPLDRPPVWIMRQAGRYMPEYQALRAGRDFLDFCRTPELCVQAAMLPIEQLDVDVAILFSDIMLPLEGMGAPVRFETGRGPVVDDPLRERAAIERLIVPDPTDGTPEVLEAVRQTVRALDGRVPLIGFAGAPFTLASYLVEGAGSRHYAHVKRMMYADPDALELLLDRLARTVGLYLAAQVEAGADAVQLFDSWGGCLSPEMFERFAARFARQALAPVQGKVPTIYYVNGCAGVLDRMRATGADVLGIDWRIDLGEARRAVGDGVGLQGNLDPCLLYAPHAVIAEEVARLVARHPGPGHIVNLGSGILPDMPVDGAQAFVRAVQATAGAEA